VNDDDEIYAKAGRAELVIDEHGIVLRAAFLGDGKRLIEHVVEGEGIATQIHPDDSELFDLVRGSVIRSGRDATIRIRWVRASGRYSPTLVTLALESEETVRVTISSDEIASARRAEAQMRRVVEGSLQGIIVRTATEVLYTNDAFAHLVGYASARELTAAQGNSGANSNVHPDDLPMIVDRIRRRMAGEEEISQYEFRLQHRDGGYRWVETRAVRAMWDGQPASLSWITDIADRKQLESDLRQSKDAAEFANRTKTEFLANMSHELRTPLNAILGFSEVIKDEMFGPAGAKYAEYARDIHRSGSHLLEIINDILDLSKLEAGKLDLHESDVNVARLTEGCLLLVRNKAAEGDVTLIDDIPDALPLLRADERAVKQVMLNFLSNAVKFTPEGGRAKIAARLTAEGFSISVIDTGIGMTPEQIKVALSAFGQVDSKLARKHEGTGLGLPICRSLLELHGGSLTVTSRPNVGTTMTALFPLSRVVSEAA
jgi:PAS domain S-box-containing protein